MNWYKIFYWVTVADGVKGFFDVVSNWTLAFSIIFFVAYWVAFGASRDSSINDSEISDKSFKYWLSMIRKTFLWFFITCIITWGAYVFCPSKKDAIIIIAGGAVGNFITSDSSSRQIPAELTLLIREKMKDEIENLKTDTSVDTLKNKTKEELIEMLKKK